MKNLRVVKGIGVAKIRFSKKKKSEGKKFSTLKSSGKIKPKHRKASEFKRIYGSKARVEWVKAQPCAWCGLYGVDPRCGGISENAHTENEGLSRKGHYTTIVPLGHFHHTQYDNYKIPFDTIPARVLMKVLAGRTEQRWLEHQSQHQLKRTA